MLRNRISDVVTSPKIKYFTTNVITGVRTRTCTSKLSKTGIQSLGTHLLLYSSFMTSSTDVVWQSSRPLRGLSPRDQRALTFNKTRQKAPSSMHTASLLRLCTNYKSAVNTVVKIGQCSLL
jgi:hypothetical protein